MSNFKCKECGLVHFMFTDDKEGDKAREFHQLMHEKENLWEFTGELERLRNIDFYAPDKLDRIHTAWDKCKNYIFSGYERIKTNVD